MRCRISAGRNALSSKIVNPVLCPSHGDSGTKCTQASPNRPSMKTEKLSAQVVGEMRECRVSPDLRDGGKVFAVILAIATDHRQRGGLRTVVELSRHAAWTEFSAPEWAARNDAARRERSGMHITGDDAAGNERRIRDARAGVVPVPIAPCADPGIAEIARCCQPDGLCH